MMGAHCQAFPSDYEVDYQGLETGILTDVTRFSSTYPGRSQLRSRKELTPPVATFFVGP
jgi:hypothetical protein